MVKIEILKITVSFPVPIYETNDGIDSSCLKLVATFTEIFA